MPVKDFEIYTLADADPCRGVHGFLRTSRRAIKRCWLDRELINRPRFFCQNIGACGSTYLIQLLRDNGVPRVFHEKAPDLNQLGVDHFLKPISQQRLVRILRYTRHNVFFEANNQFFTMTRELWQAFPQARFIHLYRDPSEAVRSAMSKPNVEPYLKDNVRLRTTIAGPASATPFEKFCHHWQIANQRIHDDLQMVQRFTGQPYLTIRFSDLIAGRLESFETFTGIKLAKRVRPPVNQRPTRAEGKFPPFESWSDQHKLTLNDICQPLFETLNRNAERDLEG